uniref:Uncharacterized protein n=1 Tax=Ditylenchus dipsaci TaxID=166011 RepID=A0A915CUZ7_9BILA
MCNRSDDDQNSLPRVYPTSVVEFALMIGVLDISSLEFPPLNTQQKKPKPPNSSRLSKFFSSNYQLHKPDLSVPPPIIESEQTMNEFSGSQKSLPPVLQDIFAKAAPEKEVPSANATINVPNCWSVSNRPAVHLGPPPGYSEKQQTSCSASLANTPLSSQITMDHKIELQHQVPLCNRVPSSSKEKNVLPVLQKLFADADEPSTSEFRSGPQYAVPNESPQQFCASVLADDQHQLNLAIARGDVPAAHAIRSRIVLRSMNAPPSDIFPPL